MTMRIEKTTTGIVSIFAHQLYEFVWISTSLQLINLGNNRRLLVRKPNVVCHTTDGPPKIAPANQVWVPWMIPQTNHIAAPLPKVVPRDKLVKSLA